MFIYIHMFFLTKCWVFDLIINWFCLSKWVRDYWLTPNVQFLSYITVKTRHIRWDGNEIRFVLDKHT
jgi:hypothetical protein